MFDSSSSFRHSFPKFIKKYPHDWKKKTLIFATFSFDKNEKMFL